MTGLENILAKIEEEARQRADSIVKEAAAQAETVREQARRDAETQSKEIAAQGEKAAADALVRAQSAAALAKRKAELATKQRLIGETIAAARQRLTQMPAEEYFPLLQKLAAAHALPQEGQVLLSPEDKKRLPASFEKELNAALSSPKAKLTVSEETRPIDGGLVLAYNGVEENCSFEALFDAKADALQDLTQSLLF